MNTNPIGVLDSGIGGLSVLKELLVTLPHESFIYVADSKNTPYGSREPEEILRLARRLIEFLFRQNVKLIIIACNTITVTGIDILRKEYPQVPMIGTVPVIKTAAQVSRNKKIGIFSTTRTAESHYQKELVEKFAKECEVFSIGSDEIVPLVEQGITNGPHMHEIVERVLTPLKEKQVDTLAVACTHFPFIENEIRAVMGSEVTLLEPSGAIARHARNVLEQNDAMSISRDKEDHFFTTGTEAVFNLVASKLLGKSILSKHIDL